MTKDQFEAIAKQAESIGRGWLSAGDIPACNVLVDGVLLANVLRVNRIRGIAEVCGNPVRLDKHHKKVIFKRVRGLIELVPHVKR